MAAEYPIASLKKLDFFELSKRCNEYCTVTKSKTDNNIQTHQYIMKNILNIIKILTAIFVLTSLGFADSFYFDGGAASSSTMKTALDKILAMPIIGQVLTDKMMDGAADKVVKNIKDYHDPDFRMAYYDCRDATYGKDGVNLYGNDSYSAVTAVIIAKVKEYLHNGDNMEKLYQEHRGMFKGKLSSLNPEEKKRAKTCISRARAAFLEASQPETIKKFEDIKTAEMEYRQGGMAAILLGKNTPPKELAEKLANYTGRYDEFDPRIKAFKAVFEEEDLGKFACRRMAEGGADLVGKYLKVLAMISEDLQ